MNSGWLLWKGNLMGRSGGLKNWGKTCVPETGVTGLVILLTGTLSMVNICHLSQGDSALTVLHWHVTHPRFKFPERTGIVWLMDPLTNWGGLVSNFFKRFYLFIYLFLETNRGRKRGRETSVSGCLSCAPHWGPGLQPRSVTGPGIQPATFWFAGQCSVHWATPARVHFDFLSLK